MEMNDALRYKLQIMRIPICIPFNVLCNNNSVMCNVMQVESTSKKKSLSVAYHKVCESWGKGATRIAYEPTATNYAKTCMNMKVLPSAAKCAKIGHILY